MGLSKPYYRIARPKSYIPNYVTDHRYASDRFQLSRAYINIERELRKIFNYIEPDESNSGVFSFELYSLLLRACTEVELNCKLIMEANGARPRGQHFTMNDYVKLERSSKLSRYKVTYNNWRKRDVANRSLLYEKKEIIPFTNFALSTPTKPQWYTAYNNVKHNREDNLESASLDNCMSAIAGILVLLYSQFGSQCIETYGNSGLCWQGIDDYDLHFDADIIFSIDPPTPADWSSDEIYDFIWDDIKGDPEPFGKFIFT